MNHLATMETKRTWTPYFILEIFSLFSFLLKEIVDLFLEIEQEKEKINRSISLPNTNPKLTEGYCGKIERHYGYCNWKGRVSTK